MAIQPCQSHRGRLIVFWAAFLALAPVSQQVSAQPRHDRTPSRTPGQPAGLRATQPDQQAVELFEKGAAAVRNHDWPGASGFFGRAVQKAPDWKLARLLHGTSLVLEGKQSEGKKVLSEALGPDADPEELTLVAQRA